MGDYESSVTVLADELDRVERVFRGLTPAEWAMPTRLVPVDTALPHWTVFELAGHFDIAIGLTRMLIEGRGDSQPGRDRTSFFINPRSETGPVVYEYAYTMVQGKTPDQMPDVLAETFGKTIEECRSVAASTVGPGYFAPMRVDEFAASRIVEAVVHGLDLTQALGREPAASPPGSRRPRRYLTTCCPGGPSGSAPPTLPTTSRGCWRRRAAPVIPTTACR